MTCRIEVRLDVGEGRFVDGVDLMSRIIARVSAMGGPDGALFRDSVGGQVGSGLLVNWDFDNYEAWAAWEDGSATDEEFQALFAEALAGDSPFVIPFERRAYTSIP